MKTTFQQAGHEPLQIGDWVEAYDTHQRNFNAEYKVIKVDNYYNTTAYKCRKYVSGIDIGEAYLDPELVSWFKINKKENTVVTTSVATSTGRVDYNHEFSQARGHSWIKLPSITEIAESIQPGKPLLVLGGNQYTHCIRAQRVAAAVSNFQSKNYILHHFYGSTDDLAKLKLLNESSVKNRIVVLNSTHLLADPQIQRVVSFLMRNKQRRIVLTGFVCYFDKILERVTKTILFPDE